MSHDAQHRPPEPLPHISFYLASTLAAIGYPLDTQLLSCAECGPHSTLHLDWDLIDGDFRLHCSRCGHGNARTYSDPMRAVRHWNSNQLERAQAQEAR